MSTSDTITFVEALNLALHDAMTDDAKVITLGEDIADPEGGGVARTTKGLSTHFGELRVKSTPISEQAIVGAAIGASLRGYKPVAEIMLMNFTAVAMDMIVNHAAKLRFMSGGQTNVPIVIRTMTGAGRQTGGQHADYLEAWFAHVAGLKVVAPSTPADAYGLLRTCIDDPDPCLFIENIPLLWTRGPRPAPDFRVPIGRAKVLREGRDLTIVSYSRVVQAALAAAEEVEASGVSIEVVDLRTIAPWDRETVFASVAKTGRAIIAHEAPKNFGVGAEIASVIREECDSMLRGPIVRLGAPSCPVPFSKPLEQAFMLEKDDIVEAIHAMTHSRDRTPSREVT